jgi:molecular chaperone HtpG
MDESLKIERHTFKLFMPGLLRVLAEHLYSAKQVAVRELLQNAHDSCQRRAIEAREEQYQPRIHIETDSRNGRLIVSDNGGGLTATEIGDYLATIGRSYTRELRDQLEMLSHDQAATLIGQFGFGFLSAFLIASEVTLITRSRSGSGSALRWNSTGDESYEMQPWDRDEPGTTVELLLKPSSLFLLHESILLDIIRLYADFLPIPIYVDNGTLPVNLLAPPWAKVDARRAITEYIARSFRHDEALWILPLHDETIDLGHDTAVLPLAGFLYIPQSSTMSVHEHGDVRVFIRHMFICDGETKLLPTWARFARGVIDSPVLQPTASRESLHQDESFEAIQRALNEQLTAALRRLAEEDPSTWQVVMFAHAQIITAWAPQDQNFFDQVADHIPFATSRGDMCLPDFLKLTANTIYYVRTKLGSLQERLLAEGHNVATIDASTFAVVPFLEAYARSRPGLQVIRLDIESTRMLQAVDDTPFLGLVAMFRQRGIRAGVASFKPATVPALIVYPEDADAIIDARGALAAGELPGPFAGMVQAYLEAKPLLADDLRGKLYLNASCPLIRRLAASELDLKYEAVLTLIYQISRLFSGRTLTSADVIDAFASATKSIESLLT